MSKLKIRRSTTMDMSIDVNTTHTSYTCFYQVYRPRFRYCTVHLSGSIDRCMNPAARATQRETASLTRKSYISCAENSARSAVPCTYCTVVRQYCAVLNDYCTKGTVPMKRAASTNSTVGPSVQGQSLSYLLMDPVQHGSEVVQGGL